MAKIDFRTVRADIYVPFDASLLEDLREAIPTNSRTYDRTRNRISVWEPYVSRAAEIFRSHYPDAEETGLPPSDTRQSPQDARSATKPEDPDFRALYLYADAPEPVARATYRALVRTLHPDVNPAIGSNRDLQELNATWERIRQKRGWT